MSAPIDRKDLGLSPALDIPPKIREYYDTLRDRIMLSMHETKEPPQLIAITSCYSGEGVSTVATNLSVTLSHNGSVLLVDANLENPSIHKIFNKEPSPGLAELLEGELEPDQKAILNAAMNLDFMAAGHLNGHLPRKVESPQRLSELLARFKREYRFTVFDTPAVNETSAAVRLVSLVDAVILVVEAERTRWETVRRVKDQLKQIKANVVGVVLNKRRFPIPRLFYRR
jgi:capsular exopolysaccharide synthesis family protein